MTSRERRRRDEFRRQAEEATANLRNGSGKIMRRLRGTLIEKGVDPLKTALVGIRVDELYSHADGDLVLPSGECMVFTLEWTDTTVENARLTHWLVDNDLPSHAVGRALLALGDGKP